MGPSVGWKRRQAWFLSRSCNMNSQRTWITVDKLYPKYTRFVKEIKQPVTQIERRYTKWQEAVKKDIERDFGVLKGTWQFLERQVLLMDLKHISMRVVTCIILHNILVSDRVMGECGVTYNLAHSFTYLIAPAASSCLQTPWDQTSTFN
jgi:Plant transposon protein